MGGLAFLAGAARRESGEDRKEKKTTARILERQADGSKLEKKSGQETWGWRNGKIWRVARELDPGTASSVSGFAIWHHLHLHHQTTVVHSCYPSPATIQHQLCPLDPKAWRSRSFFLIFMVYLLQTCSYCCSIIKKSARIHRRCCTSFQSPSPP